MKNLTLRNSFDSSRIDVITKSYFCAGRVFSKNLRSAAILVLCSAFIIGSGGAEAQADLKNEAQVVAPTSCYTERLLSMSPAYQSYRPEPADANALASNFSSWVNPKGQAVTEYRNEMGLRIYETAPVIRLEPHTGSIKKLRRDFPKGVGKYGTPSYTKSGYNYRWDGGAFEKIG